MEFRYGMVLVTKKRRDPPAVFYGGTHDEVNLRSWGAGRNRLG